MVAAMVSSVLLLREACWVPKVAVTGTITRNVKKTVQS